MEKLTYVRTLQKILLSVGILGFLFSDLIGIIGITGSYICIFLLQYFDSQKIERMTVVSLVCTIICLWTKYIWEWKFAIFLVMCIQIGIILKRLDPVLEKIALEHRRKRLDNK